jgi:hypothetical protein
VTTPARTRDPAVRALLILTGALFALRGLALRAVGFGDSEALYAAYALHPAPVYLDHPGLIGSVAGLLGQGGAPTPERAHSATIVVATLVPWLVFAVARTAGAPQRAAAAAGLAVATVPMVGIGLFAFTPDTILAPLWLGALAAALAAAKRAPGEVATGALWLVAGLFAGACGAAKASGVLLPLAFAGAFLTPALRAHARTLWPWAGLALGAIVLVPIANAEVHSGFSMLRHRFVESQAGAGLSLRNVGVFVGGQLGYVSPLLFALAMVVARELTRRRFDDATSALLFFAFAIPGAALAVLMLWSRVAEPHWLAPALLALPVAGAVEPPRAPRWLLPAGAVLGLAMIVFVHAWVLAPGSFRFARPSDPKLDISNELFGWDEAERSIREVLASEPQTAGITVVGPHWTLCAQIHARLGRSVPVGCMTPIRDDFDTWLPRAEWKRSEKLLYVTDNRFPADPATLFPDRNTTRRARARVFRGGREARMFSITLLEGAAHAANEVLPVDAR